MKHTFECIPQAAQNKHCRRTEQMWLHSWCPWCSEIFFWGGLNCREYV